MLIISPYFAPANAADMQRVRMSLPYFKQFGWEAEIITVDTRYADISKDELLWQSVPTDIKVHYVKALDKKITSKLGLGSIALRSLYYYQNKVNQLFKTKKYDLIYFSTTQFPVCVLGAYWKRKFGVPYVIDMQDPWHSDYYRDKPKQQRPPKYWFSYRLNKYLEAWAMKQVDGLISVSENYINDLKNRYPQIKNIPSAVITFGSFEPDIAIAVKNKNTFTDLIKPGFKNLIYIGRGGLDMHQAITPVFSAFKQGLIHQPELYSKLKFYFIGTSYAATSTGVPTIQPLAKQFGIESNVTEITDRIGYFNTLAILQQADALLIPGSDDPKYTASKIYPYLLTGKPCLAIFHSYSPANQVLKEYGAEFVYNYDKPADIIENINNFLLAMFTEKLSTAEYNTDALKKYSAQNLTHEQCNLFNKVLSGKN